MIYLEEEEEEEKEEKEEGQEEESKIPCYKLFVVNAPHERLLFSIGH